MKVIHITLKDIRRSFLSAFFLVFGFGVPLLTAGLFYFAFGGLGGEGGFDLPTTEVLVANLDAPKWAGEVLVGMLQSEALEDILHAAVVDDPSDARGAVDAQEADVAVTIPEGFTEAATEGAQATIYMYQDPTLTLGPRIVEMIVRGVVDGFAGSTIAVEVAADQLTARGAAVDADTQQTVRAGYQAWAMELGTDQQAGVTPLLDVQALEGEGTEAADPRTQTISLIMAGMMVFYVFFTGAVSAQSILQEEEEGTLARLFTTPTSQSTILGGKFLAAFATLFIQVAVLVVISSLIFGIDWGPPELVALMTLGQVIVATSFGIFITSLLKNTKQTGIVYGGVMTVAGMVGMASVFTASAPTGAGIADTISLVVPQGWAVRGWRLLLEGGSVSDVMVTAAVLLGLGVLFFSFGVLKFRKRFA